MLLIGLLILLPGCFNKYQLFSPNNIPIQHKIEFNSSYDKVWQAVLKALEQYPVLKADKGLGIITTGYVNTVSCQNMFYKGRKKAKKFGYFVYKLFGNKNFAIVVATEKGSPAYGKLFPKDIIINYDLGSIKQENYFKFKIYRNEKIYNIFRNGNETTSQFLIDRATHFYEKNILFFYYPVFNIFFKCLCRYRSRAYPRQIIRFIDRHGCDESKGYGKAKKRFSGC